MIGASRARRLGEFICTGTSFSYLSVCFRRLFLMIVTSDLVCADDSVVLVLDD